MPPRRQAAAPPAKALSTYWDRTQWPLQSLYFLLPLLIAYEVGTLVYAPPGSTRLPPIWAESLMGQFFGAFGVGGFYLPGIIMVAVLVSWHLVRRDPWQPQPRLFLGMGFESLALAIPLFVLMLVLFRQPPVTNLSTQLHAAAAATAPGSGGAGGLASIHSYPGRLVLAFGAGIFEELLFRLIAIALVHLVLADVLALPEPWSAIGSVAGSAVAFAAYHFATYTFTWGLFGFFTLTGIYFAAIYVLRGFGIVVAVHALYDVMVITLNYWGH